MTWETGGNTCSNLMRPPLSYWSIVVKVIELEKSPLVTWNVLRLFVNTLTVDHKYSLISKDNSMQTIQRHLFQNQNIFSEFFSSFFISTLNFEHFLKKSTLIAYVFLKLSPRKDVLRKCLKTPVWEDPSTGGMVDGPKLWFNLNASAIYILIDHYQADWVGIVRLSHVKSLKIFC